MNNNNNNNNTLNLTDADVNKLISLTKEVLKEYDIKLTDRAKGDVKITSINSDEYFILNYFIRPGSAILNFRETRYNLCLIRLNLNDNFHKNSDNTRVHGNRINIYSQHEFNLKADHSSYMVAHKLPYKISQIQETLWINYLHFWNIQTPSTMIKFLLNLHYFRW